MRRQVLHWTSLPQHGAASLGGEQKRVQRETQRADSGGVGGRLGRQFGGAIFELCSGLTTPQTMKLKGRVTGEAVVILIYSGASHNFISMDLVKRLGLGLNTTGGYGVVKGTGLTVKGEGVCRSVAVTVQDVEIVEDFLPLELGNVDVILGMQWLETLSTVAVNWQTLSMKFKIGEKSIGDPSLCKAPVPLKTIMRTLKQEGQGFWVKLGMISMEPKPGAVAEVLVPTALQDGTDRPARCVTSKRCCFPDADRPSTAETTGPLYSTEGGDLPN